MIDEMKTKTETNMLFVSQYSTDHKFQIDAKMYETSDGKVPY